MAFIIASVVLVFLAIGVYFSMPSIFGSVVVPLPEEYKGYLIAASQKYKVDTCLGAATIQIESRWNPKAISGAPAYGLGQIINGTFYSIAKKYGIDASRGPYDPETNIMVMMAYHRYNIDLYGQSLRNLAVAYNAGGGWVASSDSGLPGETKFYIDKLNRYYNLYSSVYPDFCTGPAIPGGPAVSTKDLGPAFRDFSAPPTPKPSYVDLNNFWKSLLGK